MSRFHFRLEKLLRMRQTAREEYRLELLEAQRAEDQTAMQITELQAELHALRLQSQSASRPGRLEIERLLNSQRYEQMLRNELQTAESRCRTFAAEIERRRQTLVEMDREVKALEKLLERQRTQHHLQIERKEANEADERALVAAYGRDDG